MEQKSRFWQSLGNTHRTPGFYCQPTALCVLIVRLWFFTFQLYSLYQLCYKRLKDWFCTLFFDIVILIMHISNVNLHFIWGIWWFHNSKDFEAMKAGKSAIWPKSSPNLNSCSIKISQRCNAELLYNDFGRSYFGERS